MSTTAPKVSSTLQFPKSKIRCRYGKGNLEYATIMKKMIIMRDFNYLDFGKDSMTSIDHKFSVFIN